MVAARLAEELASSIHALACVPGPPYCIESIARALGYLVTWEDAGVIGSALGFCWGSRIFVSRSGTPARDRWTLAHELAHAEADRRGLPHDETFVDRCAGGLLMPGPALVGAIGTVLDLPSVSEFFGASIEATARRVIEVERALLAVHDETRPASIVPARSIAAPPPLAQLAHDLARAAHREGKTQAARWRTWDVGAWATPGGYRGIALAVDRT